MKWNIKKRITWRVSDFIPDGFDIKIRFYCSTCQEEVLEDDFKTHDCEESK